MMPVRFYPITPIAKPRMTRADGFTMSKLRAGKRLNKKEQQRAGKLQRWLAFCDEVKARGVEVPECNGHAVFLIPMPASWTRRRRQEMHGQPHRGKRDRAQKNDKDNLEKALLDAVYGEDSGVWDLRGTKYWWDTGGIFIATHHMQLAVPFDFEYWTARTRSDFPELCQAV